jgi:hypothetical protein
MGKKSKANSKRTQLRTDGQITGMAGEFLVAGKLFKRKLLVSVTMGNAKAIDLFVHNPKTDRTFAVQVKALRAKNCFPIRKEKIKSDYTYVFVILNHDEQDEEYFIVPGKTILNDINRFFGASYRKEKPSTFPAINYGPLKPFRDNWSLFEK